MKEDKIIAILGRRMKKMQKHLEQYQVRSDPEALHQYRVEMKKLKAFLRLLNTAKPLHKRIGVGKKMKAFYGLTGHLRNLQLHQQKVLEVVDAHHLKKPIAYMALLEQEQEKVSAQLQAAVEKLSFQQFSKKVRESVPTNLSAHDSQSYLAQQLQVLMAAMVSSSYSDEALHDVRKTVKDIGYNRNHLSAYLSLALPAFLTDKKQTDALTEKLGTYHDLCVSLQLLQSPIAMSIKEQEEKAVLQEVERILEADKQQMKKEVTQ